MEYIQEKQPPDVITSDTDNQTRIDPSDAPPNKRQQFERFRAYNTGLWNGPRRENKEAIRRQDDLHLYDAISSQLDLTPFQKERGRTLIDELTIGDFTTQNGGNRPTKAVIFALCVVVANHDTQDGTRYWPHPDAKHNDPNFERVAEEIDTDWRGLVSLVMKIGHRVEV